MGTISHSSDFIFNVNSLLKSFRYLNEKYLKIISFGDLSNSETLQVLKERFDPDPVKVWQSKHKVKKSFNGSTVIFGKIGMIECVNELIWPNLL